MTDWARKTGDGDSWRSLHGDVGDDLEAAADDMTPVGVCESCQHYAFRHSRNECRHGDTPVEVGKNTGRPVYRQSERSSGLCGCQGMTWQGERYFMDPVFGVISRIRATTTNSSAAQRV